MKKLMTLSLAAMAFAMVHAADSYFRVDVNGAKEQDESHTDGLGQVRRQAEVYRHILEHGKTSRGSMENLRTDICPLQIRNRCNRYYRPVGGETGKPRMASRQQYESQ